MLIDFDLITIIIGVVCYLIWCWFIHKKECVKFFL